MKNPGLKYGAIGGAAVVAYFLLLYLLDKSYFLNSNLQWASMVAYLGAMYMACQQDCAANGTARDFREIIRTPFVTFLLINLAYWLFYYGLHLFDKDLVAMELDLKIKFTQQMLDAGTGDPEQANQYRQGLLELEKAKQNPIQPLGPVLAQMGIGAIGGFGLAAGIAALMRNK